MKLLDNLYKATGSNTINVNRTIFKILQWLVGIAGALIALSILFPKAVAVIIGIVWVLSLSIVGIFLILGVLVILGLRKEAAHILDVLVEGSLTIIDVIEFLKLAYRRFVEILKEFMLYIAPIFSYVGSALIYIILIYIYKSIGKDHDVTLFTIILTVTLVVTVALLNKPKKEAEAVKTWLDNFKMIFKRSFVDGFEVVLFVFFLTIDSTNLFFLPADLNTKIYAQLGSYNLMERGFILSDHLQWTINIIAFAVISEIIRYAMRIIKSARTFFATISEEKRTTRIKIAIRMAFGAAKTDVVRFITFTTIIFSVFLIFPRLKLLSLAITSFTNLILDIFIPERLVIVRGKDLLSRVIDKIFRL